MPDLLARRNAVLPAYTVFPQQTLWSVRLRNPHNGPATYRPVWPYRGAWVEISSRRDGFAIAPSFAEIHAEYRRRTIHRRKLFAKNVNERYELYWDSGCGCEFPVCVSVAVAVGFVHQLG